MIIHLAGINGHLPCTKFWAQIKNTIGKKLDALLPLMELMVLLRRKTSDNKLQDWDYKCSGREAQGSHCEKDGWGKNLTFPNARAGPAEEVTCKWVS